LFERKKRWAIPEALRAILGRAILDRAILDRAIPDRAILFRPPQELI
jgi:hypothetical protein